MESTAVPAEDDIFGNEKVAIIVLAEEDIRPEIESYLKRELRSLGDVELVEKEEDWYIEIIVVKNVLTDMREVGLTFSIMILSPFRTWMFEPDRIYEYTLGVVPFVLSEKESSAIKTLTENLYSYRNHWVTTTGRDSTKDTCQEIIARFDSMHLEPGRKFKGETKEKFKKIPEKLKEAEKKYEEYKKKKRKEQEL